MTADATVTSADAMAVNRLYWEEAVPVHAASEFYGLQAFIEGAPALSPIERNELGDVVGLDVLHLQCHFGMDSLDLARAGARVTGVDYAEAAVSRARALAAQLGLEARFLQANVCDPAAEVGGGYDLVFTSWGVLGWLPDLSAWAGLIGRALCPGGRFYVVEQHPAIHWFDDEAHAGAPLAVRYDFRGDGQAELYDEPGTYADRAASFANTKEYFWRHTMSDILNALIGAGLVVDRLNEHDAIVWPALPQLQRDDDGFWRLPSGQPGIPLSFSLSAHKP